MKSKLTVLFMACALVPPIAAAKDWSGQGKLGIVIARGNTNTDTTNMELKFTRESDKWRHGMGLNALRTSKDNEAIAERYVLDGKSDSKLSTVSYIFGALRYENDKFTGFDYQASLSLGYGRKLINTGIHHLDAEIGAGLRSSEEKNAEEKTDPIVRGLLNYTWKFSNTSAFLNKFLLESGTGNTFVQNEAILTTSVNKSISLHTGITVRHNSAVPAGRKKTDTLTTISLVYGF